MEMPCAHASWQPTRSGGQTTGSMVSRLAAGGARHWVTGTSSPCLSVFKPVPLGGGRVDTGPAPGRGSDAESLFWSHERLHRAALHAYEAVRAAVEGERQALEARVADAADASVAWAEHRDAVRRWATSAEAISKRSGGPFGWYWARQRALDGV